jgi:AraC-like DNA-binding protein
MRLDASEREQSERPYATMNEAMLVSRLTFDALGTRYDNVQWFLEGAIVWTFVLRGASWDTGAFPPTPRIHGGSDVWIVLEGTLCVRARRSFTAPAGSMVVLPAALETETRIAPGLAGAAVCVRLALPDRPPDGDPISLAVGPHIDARVRALAAQAREGNMAADAARLQMLLTDVRRLGIDVAGGATPLPVPRVSRNASLALDHALSQLHARPALVDLSDRLERSLTDVRRSIRRLIDVPSRRCTFREALRRWRTTMACLALGSDDRPSLAAVARATGYGSSIALCHAFARQGLRSPATLRCVRP